MGFERTISQERKNRMRFAIIDDLNQERAQALTLFEEYRNTRHIPFLVDDFDSGEDFLASFVPYTYDIIFMDIYMDGLSGVETAQHLRRTDRHSLLIFLTSSGEHMGDAFSVHAFDYLTKPIDRDKLFACLDDSMKLLPKPEEYLSFTTNGLEMRLFYGNIVVLQVSGHSTILMDSTGKEYSVYSAFSVFTKPLIEDSRFLLVSRGVLINMDFISGFTAKTCELLNGLTVPITIRKQKMLEQSWHNYTFSKLHHQAAERTKPL